MKNSFLEDLMLAMENQVPTDETMKDGASGVGNPDLPDQKAANDPDGNPPSPGDPEGNPVGKPDPDQKETELESQKKSNDCECGNPPAPGDQNGNPNPTAAPAAEMFGLPSSSAKAKVAAMDPKGLVKAYIDLLQANGIVACSTRDSVSEWMRNNRDAEPEAAANDDVLPFGSGYALYSFCKEYGPSLDFEYKDDRGKVRHMAVGARQMHRELAKRFTELEKNAPAAESTVGTDTGNFEGFAENVKRHKMFSMIPLQQENDAKDPSGNTGDPADNNQTPVSKSGDSTIADLDKFVKDSYDASGNAGSPGVNGTPVSKSGDSKELPKNEFEKAADDKDGNPDSPGVNGRPNDPTFDSFIAACEQMMIRDREPGRLYIPENMSLESYALELGMGEIAARAMEATLTAAQRRALKDSDFGLPETRQWPLNDEDHVRSAITNFHWCPKEKQRELAKNILKAMRKFGMKEVQVSEGNPFAAYCPDAIVVPRKKAAKSTETN